MKSLIINKYLLIMIGISTFSLSSLAQCNDQLLTLASEKLTNYNYVKDFKIKMKKGKKDAPIPSQRSTVILNSGARYKIYTVSAKDYDGKLIADFFSQEGIIASTYGQESHKHYESIEFECRKTGVYYISLYFEDAKEGCGICILAIEDDGVRRERMTTFR